MQSFCSCRGTVRRTAASEHRRLQSKAQSNCSLAASLAERIVARASLAPGAAKFGYIHEAEGGNKNLLFLIQSLVEIKNIRYLFLPSLCTTSPVAVFRFWVTSSICLKSKPPGLLFFFCFYTECQAFGLWMTCALV